MHRFPLIYSRHALLRISIQLAAEVHNSFVYLLIMSVPTLYFGLNGQDFGIVHKHNSFKIWFPIFHFFLFKKKLNIKFYLPVSRSKKKL